MAGSSRTPLSQLCQQKSVPRGTVTTDLTLQVESHEDATADGEEPTRVLLADVPCQPVLEQSTHIVSGHSSIPEWRKETIELIALRMSQFLWLHQLHLFTPHLHSPSWPVSVPSASCPVPCEWRKAPILADQAALCRTLAFFVGGFPYKRRNVRNISGTGETSPCNWQAGHAFLPWGGFQVTAIFTNAHRNKKEQEVKYQSVLLQLLGSTSFQLACILRGLQAARTSHW